MEAWAEEYAYGLYKESKAHMQELKRQLETDAEANPMRSALAMFDVISICRMLTVWKLLQQGERSPSTDQVDKGAQDYAAKFEQRFKEQHE